MKWALNVRMQDQPESDSNGDDLEDEMIWEDLDAFEQPPLSGERLSCFAHSLQLVIYDGMKEVKAISRAISKPPN
ncbi:hypothetical protein PBY51_007447 [Eleginops maclovinus]|uniref:Uncharacterized protein n=1 Tax=Eleginops maclovinus TaxID=56733 RepID=A0AAN7XA27_ELEMC|nr:hypothetical protein PBY51_007447 [Eleginops maclovinus]